MMRSLLHERRYWMSEDKESASKKGGWGQKKEGEGLGQQRRVFFAALMIITILLLLQIRPGWAVGNLHLGQMEIHPGFMLRETYYKMVDVDYPERGADLVSAYSPGLRAEWPIRRHTIKADWLWDFVHYREHSDWDYDGWRLSTTGNFLFGQGGRQLALDLGHVQNKIDEPAELTEGRRMRTENRYSSKLGLNCNDNLRLDFSYSLATYRYSDSALSLDNRNEDHYETSVNMRIKPKTTIFLLGQYYQIDYRDSRRYTDDSSTWILGPGIRWEATARLSGQIRFGFSRKKYQEGEEINMTVATVNLTHRLSERTRFEFGLEKGDREYSWLKMDKSGNLVEDFNKYTLHQARISLDHQLTYKLRALSGFTYEFDKYRNTVNRYGRPQNPRRDSIYAWRIGLRYQPQEWLAADLRFENRHRQSSGGEAGSDYDNQIFSFSLGLLL
ncbi:MAG: outer membrane beta-barrel protein [bacterium]|nr:outer membrane beta-barrel protein [bacterium]